MSEIVIESISRFHEKLLELELKPENKVGLLYRGQAEASRLVDCSAVRRLKKNSTNQINDQLIDHLLIGYLEFLINKARMRGFLPDGFDQDSLDLELMAQLQHQGAATGLIDFTRQPLVALWFASNGHREEDGAVYVLPRSETEEISKRKSLEPEIKSFYGQNKLWSWEVSALGNRIVAQSSVLIFGVPAIMPSKMTKLIIPAKSKGTIIQHLEILYGIKEETLFSDFPGYAVANASTKIFDITRTIPYWEEQTKSELDDAKKYATHCNCGLAYAGIGKHTEAIDQYDKAVEINGEYAAAYYFRGISKTELGRYEEAIEDYKVVICLNPQDATVHYNYGLANAMQQQYEDAVVNFSEAIRLDPKFAEAYTRRGNVKEKLKQYEGSIADFDEVTRLNPQDPKAHYNCGLAKAKRGRYGDAVVNFDEAINLNPEFAEAYGDRGNAKAGLRQYKGAIADFDKAIGLNPQFAIAYYNRGIAQLCLREMGEAKKDLIQAREKGLDIVALFEKEYGDCEHFEQKFAVALPDNIKALLEPREER